MSEALFNGLSKGLEATLPERSETEKKNTLEQAKRWALLVSAPLSHPLPIQNAMETSDWRAGAGDMTPPSTAGAGSHGISADAKNSHENRLIVRVDAGDLGEVALLVDRTDGAMRVTIGVQGAHAEAAVEVERSALTQALQNAGISVDSVNVVRGSSFGTVLAPPRTSTSTRSRENSESTASDNEAERRRLSRKLNLIG